jgi:spermidine synthase
VGAVSTTLIVCVYMAGLGLGALWGGRLAERLQRRVLFYCLIEFFIGAFGAVSPVFLDFLGKHTAGSPYGLAALSMAAFFLVPTVLMGMTLPLLTKIFSRITKNYFASVSLLYFLNTLGAAVGTLAASYGLITFGGLDIAVYAAAATNLILAGCVFMASRFSLAIPATPPERSVSFSKKPWGILIYLVAFVTGFLAIGYEMIWFRITSFLAKDSPYSFSSALAVYLLGLAAGSFWMNRALRRFRNLATRQTVFSLQFFIGLYVLGSFAFLFYATQHTSFGQLVKISFQNELHPPFVNFQQLLQVPWMHWPQFLYPVIDVFFWPILFIFPPTIAMGATFPLIAAIALTDRLREGWTVGKVYFVQIAGNVLGGVVTGFIILPFLGTERAVLAFGMAGVLFGIGALLSAGVRSRLRIVNSLLMAFALFLIFVFPGPGELYKVIHFSARPGSNFYFEEGVEGVVGTYQQGDWVENYIHGSSHGGRPGGWFYYQAIETMIFSPRVENVLVIGYGTGSTVEALLKSDEVKQVTLVEINRTLIRNLRKMPVFDQMLSDPRVRLVFDDGRRFLLRTTEKYDLVMMDPMRTTSAYSNNLYSMQFLKLVKAHLTPQGTFQMWADEYEICPRTILGVFSYVRLYGTFYIAFDHSEAKINYGRLRKLLDAFRAQMPEKEFADLSKTESLRFCMAFHGESLPLGSTVINEDWRPYTEYYLGLHSRYRNLHY